MKPHRQERYQHLKTLEYEHFTFIGNHTYQRADGEVVSVRQLLRDYKFISTYHMGPQNQKWEFNPVNGFRVKVS